MPRGQLAAELSALFETSNSPVLVAALRHEAGSVMEVERGFIVPNDWRHRAAQRPGWLALPPNGAVIPKLDTV